MAGASMDLDTLLARWPISLLAARISSTTRSSRRWRSRPGARKSSSSATRATSAVSRPLPPDWNEVREQAQRLFTRTKDLRVAILWTRAAIMRSGLVGLRDGLALMRGLLADYWDGVHPQIDRPTRIPVFA